MPDVPADAITAAALAVHRVDCDCDGNCADAPDEVDVEYATAALEAAAPALCAQGAAAEQARIRAGSARQKPGDQHLALADCYIVPADLLDGGADE